MPATATPLAFEQGVPLSIQVTIKQQDGSLLPLDNATARMQVRDAPGGTLLADLTPDVTVLGPGSVRVVVPASATIARNWQVGLYDLFLDRPGSDTIRVLHGPATMDLRISQ